MKINLHLTFFLLFLTSICFSQNKVMDVGLEMQVYPTGYIPGARFEMSFTKRDLGTARFGYQFIDHRDKGEHDDETGVGYGGSLGYKHYFGRFFRGASLGIRTDFWVNKIDWVTKLETGGETKGKTDLLVVQPTAEFGWAFPIGDNFVLTPTAAIGFERNVKTKGEPTGEGSVMLAGINLMYRIW